MVGAMIKAHLHISAIHTLCTLLEFLIAWIPIKLVAARYESHPLAAAILHVL